MRSLTLLLCFFPLLLCAQISVAPNVAIGQLNDDNVFMAGADLRYELDADEVFLRFQTGWRGFFTGESKAKQHQFHSGFSAGLKYLDFAYVVGGFAYHLDKLNYKNEAQKSWHDQWRWEMEYWAGTEFRAGPVEILPYLSIGVDGNYTLGLRVSTTINL